MRNLRSILVPCLALGLLSACAQKVGTPVANAGQPQNVNAGTFVALDGSGSTDPQKSALAYSWSFSSRPINSNTTLSDPHASKPSFLADQPGEYLVQLVVSNSVLVSAPATVLIRASTCGVNKPVVNSLTASRTSVLIGNTVAITADVSDADNTAACGNLGQTLSYHYTLVDQPAKSNARLNNADSASPSLTVDTSGPFTVRLVVTDSTKLASDSKDITITVADCGANPPTVTASVDQSSVAPGTLVNLSATPADKDISCGLPQTFTYAWRVSERPAGSNAILSGATAIAPTFTPDVAGVYEFSVIATDNTSLSSQAAFVTVTASGCGEIAPTVDLISNIGGASVGDTFTVGAHTITDNNCLATAGQFTYSWTLAGPPGSAAVFSDPTKAQPSFLADLAGSYQVSLVVTDSQNRSSARVFKTFSVAACGQNALSFTGTPITFAPAAAAPDLGTLLTLTANAVDGNSCGAFTVTPFSYRWWFVSMPNGSHASLSGASDANPSFAPDVAGSYQVGVVVTDKLKNSSPAAFLTMTTSLCGAQAPFITGSPLAIPSSLNLGDSTQLSAVVGDPDNETCGLNQTLTYNWQLLSTPPGSAVHLNDAHAKSPTFTADRAGAYVVQLIMGDSTGLSSAPATVTVTASGCGTTAPTVIANVFPSSADAQATVQLLATASDADFDNGCAADPQTYAYKWRVNLRPSGSTATLSDPTIFNPTFAGDVKGQYEFAVSVTDPTGLVSAEAFTVLSVDNCAELAPSIDFLKHTGVAMGDSFTLGANAIVDTNCVATSGAFTYSWLMTAPVGSLAFLNDPTAANPGFVADVAGAYQVSLAATNSQGRTSTRVYSTFIVAPCGQGANTISAPVISVLSTVDAVPPQQGGPGTHTGSIVTLQAAVNDTNPVCGTLALTPFKYQWFIAGAPAGSKVALSSRTSATPSFSPDMVGNYVIGLVVTDAVNNTSTQGYITIGTSPCGQQAPVITLPLLATPSSLNIGQATELSAVVTDADNDPDTCGLNQTLTYNWQFLRTPPGSTTKLSDAHATNPSFTSDASGDYVVQLVVSDSAGLSSAPAQITVNSSSCGNARPTLQANVFPPSADPLQTVQLLATASDADFDLGCATDPQTYAYRWRISNKPFNSSATLSDPTIFNPTFAGDVKGNFEFAVSVVDPTGLVSAEAFTVLTVDDCAERAPSVGNLAVTVGNTDVSGGMTVGSTVTASAQNVVDSNCLVPNPSQDAFAWTLLAPAGSGTVLSDPAQQQPTFTPDLAGNYQLSLVVTNSQGKSSTKIFLTVVAFPCSVPLIGWATQAITETVTDPDQSAPAPQTDANNNQEPNVGGSVQFTANAIASNTCNGTPVITTPLTYQWVIAGKPQRSQAQLDNATLDQPTLQVDVNGSYLIAVVAMDQLHNRSAPRYITVSTTSCGTGVPFWTDEPFLGQQLSGSGAFDPFALSANTPENPDNATDSNGAFICPARFQVTNYTYAWKVVAPSDAKYSLSPQSGANVNFQPLANADFTLQLVATGGNGIATVPVQGQRVISVNCPAPGISGIDPVVAAVFASDGDNVRLDGNGNPRIFKGDRVQLTTNPFTTCAASDAFTYQWTLQGPGGSVAVLSSSTDQSPSFIADQAGGTYNVTVQVTDSFGMVVTSNTVSLVVDGCGTNAVFADWTDLPGAKAFDAHTLTTTLASGHANFSSDDDITVCPVRFAQTYTSSWSVISSAPDAGYLFDSLTGSPVHFTPGGNATFVVQLSLKGNKSGVSTSVVKQIGVSCANITPLTGAISLTAVSPSADGFVRAPGQFFRDDTATFHVTPVSTCTTSPTYGYFWTLTDPAGSVSTLSSQTAAAPSFVADVASGTWTVSVYVRDVVGNLSPTTTQAFTADSCGINPVSLQLTDTTTGSPLPFDPRTVLATASSNDDVGSVCPARFANASYAISFNITGVSTSAPIRNAQAGPRSTITVTPNASNARQSTAVFAFGDTPVNYTLHASAVASTSHNLQGTHLSAGNQIDYSISCGVPSPVANQPTPSIAAVTFSNVDTGTAPAFSRDDTVKLSSSFTSACFSPGNAVYSYTWDVKFGSTPVVLDGAGTSSTNVQPTFVANAPNRTFAAHVVVKDQWQYTGTSTANFTSGSCGANAVTVSFTDAQTNGNGAFDPHTLTASASSADDTAACAVRFHNASYAFDWSASGPSTNDVFDATGAGTASAPLFTTSNVNFQAGDVGTWTITAVATGNVSGNSNSAGVDRFHTIDAECTPTPVLAAVSVTGASVPHAGGDFNQGDHVTLVAAPDVSSCYQTAANAQLATTWTINDVAASPAFTVSGPGATYAATEQVTDRFGHSNTVSGSFTASNCGNNAIVVDGITQSQASGAKPMDAHDLGATFHAPDADPTLCPQPTFAPSGFTFSWASDASDGSSFSAPTAQNTSFTPASSASHLVNVVVSALPSAFGSTSPAGANNASVSGVCPAPSVGTPALATINGAAPGSQIYNGDVLGFSASPVSNCKATPTFQYSWNLSGANSGETFADASAAAPNFTVASYNDTYSISLSVIDDSTQNSGVSPTLQVTSNGCGLAAPILTLVDTNQPLPGTLHEVQMPDGGMGPQITSDLAVDEAVLPDGGTTGPAIDVGTPGQPLQVATPFYLNKPITMTATVDDAPNAACPAGYNLTGGTLNKPATSGATLAAVTPHTINKGDTVTFSFTPDVGDLPPPGNPNVGRPIQAGGPNRNPPLTTTLYGVTANVTYGKASTAANLALSSVEVGGRCGNATPQPAFFGSTPTLGQPDSLDASASFYSDNLLLQLPIDGSASQGCGLNRPLNFTWVFVDGAGAPTTPPGLPPTNGGFDQTNPSVQSAGSPVPAQSFTPVIAGTYHVKLHVDDGTNAGDSQVGDFSAPPLINITLPGTTGTTGQSTGTVTVTLTNSDGTPPPAEAVITLGIANYTGASGSPSFTSDQNGVTTVGGVASFNNVTYSAAGGYTLNATATDITTSAFITSTTSTQVITISDPPPPQLVWVSSNPSPPFDNGGPGTNIFTIQTQDGAGNPVSGINGDVTVTFDSYSGPFSSGQVNGQNAGGTLTFTGALVDGVANINLQFSPFGTYNMHVSTTAGAFLDGATTQNVASYCASHVCG